MHARTHTNCSGVFFDPLGFFICFCGFWFPPLPTSLLPWCNAGIVLPSTSLRPFAEAIDARVPDSRFKDDIISVNLTALGIKDFGSILCNTGLGSCPASDADKNGRMELFVNGNPLVRARFPNINASTGYWQWENIKNVCLCGVCVCVCALLLCACSRVCALLLPALCALMGGGLPLAIPRPSHPAAA